MNSKMNNNGYNSGYKNGYEQKMNRYYKTPRGTELPLLNLRGKEYLEVKYRLVWFREDHPDWSIETEILSVTDQSCYARASIRDESGRIIATSHKFESKLGFPDFIEKAETGAIGRALALIGYGTQFCADELDEGERIVDAPVDAPANKQASDKHAVEASELTSEQVEVQSGDADKQLDPGDYRVSFGKKYKGMRLKDIPRKDIESYLDWLEVSAERKGQPLSDEVRYLKSAVSRFLEDSKQH
jgi:hypothetical protein